MTDAPELLPCPFCGGAAEWVDIESGDCFGGSFIQCAACWACSPVEFGFKENLTSKWNTRVPDPRVAVLVEACMSWGMHIAPEDATAADPFRDIRAALAAFKGGADG